MATKRNVDAGHGTDTASLDVVRADEVQPVERVDAQTTTPEEQVRAAEEAAAPVETVADKADDTDATDVDKREQDNPSGMVAANSGLPTEEAPHDTKSADFDREREARLAAAPHPLEGQPTELGAWVDSHNPGGSDGR